MFNTITSVHKLEKDFQVSDIGKKYTHDGLYGRDTITIIGKKEGFGILFHSEITGKDHYMYDTATLKIKS